MTRVAIVGAGQSRIARRRWPVNAGHEVSPYRDRTADSILNETGSTGPS